MTTINKKKIEEFIRVDHAGERGAVKIYEGQLLALNTLPSNIAAFATMALKLCFNFAINFIGQRATITPS